MRFSTFTLVFLALALGSVGCHYDRRIIEPIKTSSIDAALKDPPPPPPQAKAYVQEKPKQDNAGQKKRQKKKKKNKKPARDPWMEQRPR